MYLLIHVHIEGPLHEGKGHLQGFHPQWGAVISNELQPLNAHQPTVAGCILLQILAWEWEERQGEGWTVCTRQGPISQAQGQQAKRPDYPFQNGTLSPLAHNRH